LFAKLFAKRAEEVKSTFFGVAEHWHPRLKVHVQQPVAYWRDMKMLLSEPVRDARGMNVGLFDEGLPLQDRMRWMHELGAGLAELHDSGLNAIRRVTLEQEVRALANYGPLMARLAPDLASRFGGILASLSSRTDSEDSDLVPSHGSMRTDQVLIAGDSLVLLDWDAFCMAPPSRDISNLLAYLDWKAIREPHRAAVIEQARASFIEGYGSVRPSPEDDFLAPHRAASMLKIAGRRYQDLWFEEWPLIPELLRRASAALQE
jgi:Ser/Thr protein kinase RdoA (MazF antagonist)